MHEALALVRDEMGPGAALLHTRQVPRRGILGWLGKTEFELAATDQPDLPSRFESFASAMAESSQHASEPGEAEAVPATHSAEVATVAHRQAPTWPGSADAGIDLEDAAIAQTWNWRESYPQPLAAICRKLQEADVPVQLAHDLCNELLAVASNEEQPAEPVLAETLRNQLLGSVAIGHGLDDPVHYPRIVAAVGPTGVGKTTTIAKLAARAKFEHRRTVGLVTVDTYRIAAVDQLQTYAEIMDLPMKIVATPTEVRRAIDELADCQQIFIDTAGRSPRDEVQVQQLKSILKAASPDEVYLVLSATSSAQSLAGAVEKFARVAPTSWVLTKIDEVQALGNTLKLLQNHHLPLSYITNGQEVPHAIAAADAEELIGRIL